MQLFSFYHIMYLFICAITGVSFYLILRKKSKKVQRITILSILFASFIIHFFKLLIPVYRNNLPDSLISITPETLCAISTIIFPFIFISQNKALKDYMIVFGVISGILTLLLPGDILGLPPFNIEVIRFFFAHFSIFICPLLVVLLSIDKPSEHWIRNTLIILFAMINVIILNQLVFAYALNGQEGLDSLKNTLLN